METKIGPRVVQGVQNAGLERRRQGRQGRGVRHCGKGLKPGRLCASGRQKQRLAGQVLEPQPNGGCRHAHEEHPQPDHGPVALKSHVRGRNNHRIDNRTGKHIGHGRGMPARPWPEKRRIKGTTPHSQQGSSMPSTSPTATPGIGRLGQYAQHRLAGHEHLEEPRSQRAQKQKGRGFQQNGYRHLGEKTENPAKDRRSPVLPAR